MKKYGLRVLVGLIAFAIGVSVVIRNLNQPEICYVSLKETKQPEISTSTYPTNPKGKIEVRFLGFGKIENRPTLKFEVINHLSDFVKYRANEKGKLTIFAKSNGNKNEVLWNGLCFFKSEFNLEPNESIKTEVFADSLIFYSLKETRNFEFGFSYYTFEQYVWEVWSEPTTISEKMKKDIIKNAPKLYKLGTD